MKTVERSRAGRREEARNKKTEKTSMNEHELLCGFATVVGENGEITFISEPFDLAPRRERARSPRDWPRGRPITSAGAGCLLVSFPFSVISARPIKVAEIPGTGERSCSHRGCYYLYFFLGGGGGGAGVGGMAD